MNPARLLVHFERIAEAPDAVPRLRRFILDLAVRGKLVVQDPGDEPATELLRRIQTEKVRLLNAGEIRKSKANELKMVTAPYDLPRSWAWAALGSIFLYDAGAKREPNMLDQSHWLLELEDIEKDTGRLVTRVRASERASQSTKSEFKVGDILYGKLRPYLNKVLVADEPGYSTTEIVAIRSFAPLCSKYCALALRRPDFVEYVTRLGQGTKMPRLRTEDANVAPFPLPPLAEQHRIVAKVDELMALCDRLEAAQTEREQRRDRLVTASLNRINQPAPSAEGEAATAFREHARFHLDHLPRLTTRLEHIKALHQTILNLAVRGKLVEQDPTDKPAQLSTKTIQSAPCSLPGSWRYLRLEHLLAEGTRNGYSRKPDDALDGVPILRISAGTVRQDGLVAEEEHKLISGIDDAIRVQYGLIPGDLLACRFNGNKSFVGRLKLFRNYLGIAPIYPDKLIRVRVNPGLAVPGYIRLAGDSDLVRHTLEDSCATTVGNWGISASNLKDVPFPIPPLAEQQRIVAKVDELMAVCDQLEASLTATQTDSRRLLEVVLQEALAPAMEKAA
ncbi:MAG: restriction endonuclease subunit S [Chromatiaceae bacterium]|nr:restriction endonuclease subunit S [Chromatiaceae bacterium]